MNKFTHFLFYNNTIPIAFGILFLGAGATFAASPQARESVIDSEVIVTAVDNSFLLESTINDAAVLITIGSVNEDDTSYYIEYQMETIEPRDGAWQPTTRTKTLVVNKESVVGRDLGLYAEEEIAEVHAAEVRLLKDAQVSERRAGLTPKVVTTEYSGLVGQFFDASDEVFPQYNPIISPNEGIPLTREQEKAHEAVRRLIEEAKEKEQPINQNPDDEESGEDENTEPEETPPPVEDPSPEPEPEDPTPEPQPTPEPEPEEPISTEPIPQPEAPSV